MGLRHRIGRWDQRRIRRRLWRRSQCVGVRTWWRSILLRKCRLLMDPIPMWIVLPWPRIHRNSISRVSSLALYILSLSSFNIGIIEIRNVHCKKSKIRDLVSLAWRIHYETNTKNWLLERFSLCVCYEIILLNKCEIQI